MWRQLVLLLLAAPLAAGFALPRSVRSGLACRSTAKDDEMFSPDKLKEVVEAEQAAPETKEQKQGFWTWLDETTWDLFQGRKERIWAPDRRPEDERGPFDKSKSSLSWGDESKLDEQLFRPLAPSQDELKQAAVQAPIVGLASGEALRESDSKQDEQVTEFSERLKRLETESVVPDGEDRFLDGRQLAELVFAKYGRYHDCAMLRTTGQVAFNIYGPALGDRRGFGYTESQYLEKLDTVAAMLNDFDQAWYVRGFLLEPIYPRRGLPSTPRADTAVTLRLNTSPTWRYVDPEKVEGWFSLYRG